MSDAIAWVAIMNALHGWVVGGSGLPDTSVTYQYYDPPQTRPLISLNISSVGQVCHDWVTYADNPLVFTPVVSTASAASVIHSVAHGFLTGDGPIRLTGAVPIGLAVDTDYWLIVVDADHLRVSDTFVHAMTGVSLTFAGVTGPTINATDESLRAGQELIKTAQGPRQCTLAIKCFGDVANGILPMSILSNVVSSLQLYVQDLDDAGVGVSDLGAAFSQGDIKSVSGTRGSLLEPQATFELTFYVDSSLSAFESIIDTVEIAVKLQNIAGTSLPEIDLEITGV